MMRATLVFPIVLAACGTQPPGAREVPEAPLPIVMAQGDCSPPPAPTGCEWAMAADAIVVGTITDLRLIDYPAEVATYPSTAGLVTSCDGVINPALEIELAVESTLLGDLGGTVSIRIGAGQIDMFRPMPYHGSDGSLQWTWGSGAPLVIGQQVGAALHFIPEYSLWSLMGEPLFAVVTTTMGLDVISFQEFDAECLIPPPAVLGGLTISELAVAVASCPVDAGAARAAVLWNTWGPGGQPASSYFAAVCIPPPDSPSPVD